MYVYNTPDNARRRTAPQRASRRRAVLRRVVSCLALRALGATVNLALISPLRDVFGGSCYVSTDLNNFVVYLSLIVGPILLCKRISR